MDRQEGLRRLLWGWDRIGVADLAPDDEYDCLVQPLLARLRGGADRAVIRGYLAAEVAGHFGLDPAYQTPAGSPTASSPGGPPQPHRPGGRSQRRAPPAAPA